MSYHNKHFQIADGIIILKAYEGNLSWLNISTPMNKKNQFKK